MVPIWYMQVRQPAHSDIVTDHTKFEGSCQNPFLGAQARNVAPWAEGRILAGGGYAARRGGRRLGLERGLLDDSGHRLQPPGRTAARPQIVHGYYIDDSRQPREASLIQHRQV